MLAATATSCSLQLGVIRQHAVITRRHADPASAVEALVRSGRTMEHPAVLGTVPGAPPIKFYAGAPLVASNGYRYGSLCALLPAGHVC